MLNDLVAREFEARKRIALPQTRVERSPKRTEVQFRSRRQDLGLWGLLQTNFESLFALQLLLFIGSQHATHNCAGSALKCFRRLVSAGEYCVAEAYLTAQLLFKFHSMFVYLCWQSNFLIARALCRDITQLFVAHFPVAVDFRLHPVFDLNTERLAFDFERVIFVVIWVRGQILIWEQWRAAAST